MSSSLKHASGDEALDVMDGFVARRNLPLADRIGCALPPRQSLRTAKHCVIREQRFSPLIHARPYRHRMLECPVGDGLLTELLGNGFTALYFGNERDARRAPRRRDCRDPPCPARKHPAMNDADLDALYTRLCRTMTALGEAQAPLYLARFALLAMTQIDDRAVGERLIIEAAAGLDNGAEPASHA